MNNGSNKIYIDGKKIGIGVGILLVLLMIVWVIIENVSGGDYIIGNKSSYNIDYIESTFIKDDWLVSDSLKFENIEKNSSNIEHFGEYELNHMEASLELKIKFEGYNQVILVAGYFNQLLTGDIKLEFSDFDNEQVKIKIKSQNSIISGAVDGVNEEYIINLKEGYIE